MANATILYACTSDGLAVVNKPGTLDEWLPPRVALSGRAVLAAWADPGPPIVTLGAAGEGAGGEAPGLLRSNTGGRAWQDALEAPVTSLYGPPGGLPSVYAGLAGGGLLASADLGLTWALLPGPSGAGAVHLIMGDVRQEGRLFLLAERGLFAGRPDEAEWASLPAEGIHALAQDSVTGDLYAATAEGIQVSMDDGGSWAVLPASPTLGRCIATIPAPGDAAPSVLVGTPSGLLASHDGGANWEAVALPAQDEVTALVRDPERRDRLYMGRAGGLLFESGNRGRAWTAVVGTPLAPVNSLFVIRI